MLLVDAADESLSDLPRMMHADCLHRAPRDAWAPTITELIEQQAEKSQELQAIEKKRGSIIGASILEDFATDSAQMASTQERLALSDKVKSEVKSPFFSSLPKAGHELMMRVHEAAIEMADLPLQEDTIRVQLQSLKEAQIATRQAAKTVASLPELNDGDGTL